MDTTKKELYTAKRPSGLDTSDQSVHSAIEKLRSDEDPVNWLLLKTDGPVLSLHAAGTGGLVEFSSVLTNDEVLFGALRCLVDGKVRFYHFFFVGQNVGAMKKGKASMFKSAVFSLIDAHGEISCSGGLEEYTDSLVVNGISKLSGAANIEV